MEPDPGGMTTGSLTAVVMKDVLDGDDLSATILLMICASLLKFQPIRLRYLLKNPYGNY